MLGDGVRWQKIDMVVSAAGLLKSILNQLNKPIIITKKQTGFWFLEHIMGVVGAFAHILGKFKQ